MDCRACGTVLRPVLDLGKMALANAYLTEANPQEEATFPLELAWCPTCSLAQLTETVSPEILFRDYLYFSGFSVAMGVHAQELVRRTVAERGLGPKSLAVELASNDGYLLQHYVAAGVPVLGIEPARNIAAVANSRGIRTLPEFFGRDLARSLRSQGLAAQVLHANNVLAHVADLPGFVEGIRTLLADDGVALIEVPHLLEFLRHHEFDTIYHEHLYYFSLTALVRIFGRHDLSVQRVERLPLHGGSLLLHVVPGKVSSDASVSAMLEEEEREGLNREARYLQFAGEVQELRRAIHDFAVDLRSQGLRLAAYGAAAKGTVLLNSCALGPDLLEFVVDRSPYKQGRWMPGVHLPILPPEALLQRRPDATLLLAWNFAEEILQQQQEYRKSGRFWRPIPAPSWLP